MIVKRLLIVSLFIANFLITFAQAPVHSVTTGKAVEYLKYLSSDEMKGRGNFSPELKLAKNYISTHFTKAGLHPFKGFDSLIQEYKIVKLQEEEKNTDSRNKVADTFILANVVGVLPGKSLPHELVIFSAHYDHIGNSGTTVFNGANDNASGVATLLALVDHYSSRKDNERTIIFCAFSGEELGLLGSQSFVNKIHPPSVMAVINLEMLGVSPKKNSIFFTGSGLSSMQKIFKKNLKGEKITIIKDPELRKDFFERSDNLSFALKGIPAHTIMATDNDDLCYHQPCDEIARIDFENLNVLIGAIIKGTATIINGVDTPSRINPKKLEKPFVYFHWVKDN